MILKKLTKLLLLLILISGMFSLSVEVFAENARLTFTTAGCKYVVSDCPEGIYNSTAGYTVQTSVYANEKYDFYVYHQVGRTQIGFGIAVKNTHTYPVTVHYGYSNNISKDTAPTNEALACADCELWYNNKTAGKYISGSINIPAAKSETEPAYVWIVEPAKIYAEGKKTLNLRAWISATDSVTTRVAHGSISLAASNAFNAPRDIPSGGPISANFTRNGLSAVYTYKPSTPSFILSGIRPRVKPDVTKLNDSRWSNINEYEAGTSAIFQATNTVKNFTGNYGAIYDITIIGAKGKSLYCTPWFENGYFSDFLLNAPADSSNLWYETGLIKTGNKKLFNITSNKFRFRYILPGGQNGKVCFSVK